MQGTTLEQPPAQPNGGGFNSSLSDDTITLASPLAPGQSVPIQFKLGIMRNGAFRFFPNGRSQRNLAIAADACDGHDFARMQGERHIPQPVAAGGSGADMA